MISSFSCSTNSYRSKKLNSCKLFPSGFTQYSAYPFTCYHFSADDLNYDQAKAYCLQKKSVLINPKSLAEQSFISNYRDVGYWIDSTISYIGEPYLWSDGSKVGGFIQGELNNSDMDFYTLKENVILYLTYKFYDFPKVFSNVFPACQIID